MLAITVRDRTAGIDGLRLTELPYPHAAENDVIVRVHAAGFTPGELDWPATWSDRAGRDRTPSVPGHELSGVVAELGFGTTGLTIGQRVFGLADWTRNGSLAEYVAVEARNLAPLPADIDHTVAAALPISGLTAWQGLFDHARLVAGQTVLITGAAGGVGSMAVQLAREAGARVIGAGRSADRDTALGLGADAFLDLQIEQLEDVGEVDVVFDVIGGEVLDRSAALVRAGGTLVTVAAPPRSEPTDGRAVFFVVEPDRARLADLARRLQDGRLTPIVGAVRTLPEAPGCAGLRAKDHRQDDHSCSGRCVGVQPRWDRRPRADHTLGTRPARPLVRAVAWLVAAWCVGFATVNVAFETTGRFTEGAHAEYATALSVMDWIVAVLKILGATVALVSVTQTTRPRLAAAGRRHGLRRRRTARSLLPRQHGPGHRHAHRRGRRCR